MPPLLQWLPRYALPSLLSIAAPMRCFALTQRAALRQTIADDVAAYRRSPSAASWRPAASPLTAVALMAASALDWQLGLPTFVAGVATAAVWC